MSYRSPAPRRRCAALLVALLCASSLAACRESPFAPAPDRAACGSSERPCELDCSLACLGSIIDIAATCAVTLEGRLSNDRKSCSFDDGSSLQFNDALPTDPATAERIGFALSRAGKECVSALISRGAASIVSELTIGGEGVLRQREVLGSGGSTGGDGGSGDLGPGDGGSGDSGAGGGDGGAGDGGADRVRQRVTLSCPDDGKVYGASGDFCNRCDAGCGGTQLLDIAVTYQRGVATIALSGAGRFAPLATCR